MYKRIQYSKSKQEEMSQIDYTAYFEKKNGKGLGLPGRSKTFAMYYPKYFDCWFFPDKFDWEYSRLLAWFCSDNILKWWDPVKFNWEDGSSYLAGYCSEHFDTWWDASKFKWENGSSYLAGYCSEHFHAWFDPSKFVYNNKSSYWLAKRCSDHFDTWFNKDLINFNECSRSLAEFCGAHIDKWWDGNKFNWRYHKYLTMHCSHSDIWKAQYREREEKYNYKTC